MAIRGCPFNSTLTKTPQIPNEASMQYGGVNIVKPILKDTMIM